MTTTMIILGAAAVYALARGIMDIVQRRYVWGAAGILSAALLVLTPIATHAVKIGPAPSLRTPGVSQA